MNAHDAGWIMFGIEPEIEPEQDIETRAEWYYKSIVEQTLNDNGLTPDAEFCEAFAGKDADKDIQEILSAISEGEALVLLEVMQRRLMNYCRKVIENEYGL